MSRPSPNQTNLITEQITEETFSDDIKRDEENKHNQTLPMTIYENIEPSASLAKLKTQPGLYASSANIGAENSDLYQQ